MLPEPGYGVRIRRRRDYLREAGAPAQPTRSKHHVQGSTIQQRSTKTTATDTQGKKGGQAGEKACWGLHPLDCQIVLSPRHGRWLRGHSTSGAKSNRSRWSHVPVPERTPATVSAEVSKDRSTADQIRTQRDIPRQLDASKAILTLSHPSPVAQDSATPTIRSRQCTA